MSQETDSQAQESASLGLAPVDGSGPQRRTYEAPRLRHLGSVRTLTLGSNGGVPEGHGAGKASRRA